MESQDNNFNYKIILAALAAVIIGILIAFYYSNVQSNNEISNLELEKSELVEGITFLETEVNNLRGKDESNILTIAQLQESLQQSQDSIGQLNFDINKQKEYRRKLRQLESDYDSIRYANRDLLANNKYLNSKLKTLKKEVNTLKAINRAYAKKQEDLIREKRELQIKYATKTYLDLDKLTGVGAKVKSGKDINSDKASGISKLKGYVTIKGMPKEAGTPKIIYFQFLDPDKRVIGNNANIINLNGNEYSKRLELIASTNDIRKEGFIKVPAGSLKSGVYTLNVFEDEKLLSTTEFTLK